MKAGLADTQKGMCEDKKFLEDLYEQCAKKKTEWDTECKTRAEDLLAHADTFKILDDDGALELFKKTFPSPAVLLQTEVSFEQIKQQALSMISSQGNYQIDLIGLFLRGKKVSLQIVAKRDATVGLFGKELVDDGDKKDICEMQVDKNVCLSFV